MGEPSTTVDVDNLSFAVRAQKFRIAASIMKRTSIPLTRSTPRVWCISSAALRRKSSPASSIPTSLRRVCCCRTAELGTGRGSRGHLRLSQRGQSALSPLDDTLNIFEVDDIMAIVSFDLVSFAPVVDAELADRDPRLVEELPIADKSKAANSEAVARDAYDLHFQRWEPARVREWVWTRTPGCTPPATRTSSEISQLRSRCLSATESTTFPERLPISPNCRQKVAQVLAIPNRSAQQADPAGHGCG
jgi:hypothetical protein